MNSFLSQDDRRIVSEVGLKNLGDILESEDNFNSMSQSLYQSIPFDSGFGKRDLMIMISDSIDAGNSIEIEEEEVEEFIDVYIKAR